MVVKNTVPVMSQDELLRKKLQEDLESRKELNLVSPVVSTQSTFLILNISSLPHRCLECKQLAIQIRFIVVPYLTSNRTCIGERDACEAKERVR